MSSSIPAGGITLPNLVGGYPTKSYDLIPTVIFLILYTITLPLIIFRLISSKSRTLLLLRPLILVFVRLATLAIRLYMEIQEGKKKIPSTTIIIIEQVFLSVGFVLLVEPLSQLLFKYKLVVWVRGYHSPGDHLRRITAIALSWLLIGAIVLGVIAGVDSQNAAKNPEKAKDVKNYKLINAALILAVLGIILAIVTVYTMISLVKRIGGDRRNSLFLFAQAATMVTVSSYRLSLSIAQPSQVPLSEAASHTLKLKFYILQLTMEYICLILFGIVNLKSLFQIEQRDKMQADWMRVPRDDPERPTGINGSSYDGYHSPEKHFDGAAGAKKRNGGLESLFGDSIMGQVITSWLRHWTFGYY